MGEISDIDYSLLAATSDNFIRLETLNEANNRVSNAITKLPIFRHYDIDEVIHSSSDGQKFETKPDIHSIDKHGTNEVNFFILNFFGYQFAPRYKDIYDKIGKSLYGFNHPSQYGDVLIKPIRKINSALIVEELENIQRIILSLALKTQSIIIGKLSDYVRKNKTKRALWEYDNIIKSLYFLDYIDSLSLRRNVQRALNRGESYHKLRRAISHANFGKLRFKTEQEQNIFGECNRLLANCIIYYNTSILSNMLAYREANGKDSDVLKHISPVAWQHINLYGRYNFNTSWESINMDAIILELD